MASNLPSSFSSRASSTSSSEPNVSPQYSPTPEPRPKPASSADSSAALFIAILALGISLVSLYGVFFAEKPLGASQKEALLGIAKDLRSLQAKEISLSAPVSTSLAINQSYPIKEVFPETFEIPLEFSIPVDTQLVAVSTTGQPVVFKVQESIPVKVKIPISSASAFGSHSIKLNKTIPVDVRLTSTVKIKAAYGTELNNIIDRLEAIAGGTSVSSQ
ncbi:MAG: hypothetical protein N3F07_03530 [Candidatus Micrarchaeota archaeon]|nr:hypothetical protein [Candidatus Micrarchaeota archaeon]